MTLTLAATLLAMAAMLTLFLTHTHTPILASLVSVLSFGNDNYPSIGGALLLEMKMDGISVKCSGRCIVAATRNYTVRTIEPPHSL